MLVFTGVDALKTFAVQHKTVHICIMIISSTMQSTKYAEVKLDLRSPCWTEPLLLWSCWLTLHLPVEYNILHQCIYCNSPLYNALFLVDYL